MNIKMCLPGRNFVDAKWIDDQFFITVMNFSNGCYSHIYLFDPSSRAFFYILSQLTENGKYVTLPTHLEHEDGISMKILNITTNDAVFKEYIMLNDKLPFQCTTEVLKKCIKLTPTNIFEFCKAPSAQSLLKTLMFVRKMLFVDLVYDIKNIISINLLHIWYNNFDAYAETIKFKCHS